MKRILVLFLILMSTVVLAQSSHSAHMWQKVSQVVSYDTYGNRITVCMWQCNVDWQNPHQLQTSGMSLCPMPY